MTTYPQVSDSMAALSRADGTTEAHDLDHGRVIKIWENVKHHGAKGDGATDDTAAIQAAISTNAGVVYFPPGTYFLADGSSLTLSAAQTLRGTGRRESLISSKNAYALKSVGSGSQDECRIEHLGFRLRAGATSGGAIKAFGTVGTTAYHAGWHAVDLEAQGVATSTDPLYYLDGLIGGHFYRVTASLGGGRGFFVDGDGSFVANENLFLDCSPTNCAGYGWHIRGGGGTTIIGGDIEGCAGGVKWENTTMPRLIGVWAESNSLNHVNVIGPVVEGLVMSNKFHNAPTTHIRIEDSAFGSSLQLFENRFQDAGSDPNYPTLYVGTNSSVTVYTAPGTDPTSTITKFGQTSVGPGSSYAPLFVGGAGGATDVDAQAGNRIGFKFNDVGSDPDAAAANSGRLYGIKVGGKMKLCVRFPTGAVQVIATEP